MKAMVFCRPCDPFGAGHVGWGFEVSPGLFSIGAVEEDDGLPYSPPGQTGFWSIFTETPTKFFVWAGDKGEYSVYDLFKTIDVSEPNAEAASAAVALVKTLPFIVGEHDCLTAVAQILKAYGTELPNPNAFPDQAPMLWFNQIPLAPQVLMDRMFPIDISLYGDTTVRGAGRHVARNDRPEEIDVADISTLKEIDTVGSLIVRNGSIILYDETNFFGNQFVANTGDVYWDVPIKPKSFKATPDSVPRLQFSQNIHDLPRH
jgi:hypothetical protein